MAGEQGTIYVGDLNRAHMGGANGELRQKIEQYLGWVDTTFEHTRQFTAWTTSRSTNGDTDIVRMDRMGDVPVLGRRSGGEIKSQRIKTDKFVVIVDTALYIRLPFDYQDNWTNPNRLQEIGVNNGTNFALAYDQAHIIQLQKSRTWTAPAHLKPSFHDAMHVEVNVKANAANIDDLEANANALLYASTRAVEYLVKRRIPRNDMVWIVDPTVYSCLMQSKKLISSEFSQGNGDYANRTIHKINGIEIVELSTFPESIADSSPLDNAENGNNFKLVADDLKCKMILFSKTRALLTVTAKDFWTKYWDDHTNAAMVLDSWAMYTVALRRPDTVINVMITEV